MSEPERSVSLGVLVAPGLPEEVSTRIADDLAEDLREAYAALGWWTEFVVDRLVVPPAETTQLVEAARRALLERGWDFAVVVTDLPLRHRSRPVSRHVSRTHGVALVSLPALGPLHLKRRLRRVLRELAGELVGAGSSLREVAADAEDVSRFPYVPTVIFGHLRLLAGMVRANRPWRLAARLYGVLAAAFAAGAYGIVASDVWRLSAALSWWRLLAVCLASLAVTIVAVIVAHELWERAPDPRARAQVLLFNVTTVTHRHDRDRVALRSALRSRPRGRRTRDHRAGARGRARPRHIGARLRHARLVRGFLCYGRRRPRNGARVGHGRPGGRLRGNGLTRRHGGRRIPHYILVVQRAANGTLRVEASRAQIG